MDVAGLHHGCETCSEISQRGLDFLEGVYPVARCEFVEECPGWLDVLEPDRRDKFLG